MQMVIKSLAINKSFNLMYLICQEFPFHLMEHKVISNLLKPE